MGENSGIILYPIGYIRTSCSDEAVRSSVEGVEGFIEVLESYAEGLEGIGEFSHIIVVAYLHKIQGRAWSLKVRPKGPLKHGVPLEELPLIGVFSTNSPYRPNPIAVSVLRVIRVENNKIYVSHLDLYDGTPVLDIKPYTPDKHVDYSELKVPRWLKKEFFLR